MRPGALADHAIDVALVRQLASPAGLQRRTLREEEFVLALPRVWDLSHELPADLAIAADLPWIWLPRHTPPITTTPITTTKSSPAAGPDEGVRFVRFRGAASIELAAVWLEHPGNPAVATFVRTVTGP